MGLQTSRGDKLSVVALPMPAMGAGSATLQPKTVVSNLTPYLRSGFAGTVALVLLLLLGLAQLETSLLANRAQAAVQKITA